ncbi:MAG: diguanylate cyclase [Gammaproteobacteria bacterium]
MDQPIDATFQELKQTGRMPTPGGVALKLLELSRRSDVNVAEVARVLQADPALTARVVKLANAAGRGTRPIVAVRDAVAILGLALVRQIALGFSLLNDHRIGRCAGFDYERFWSAALATAIAAQHVSRETRIASGDECFSVGLLLDIGALALATVHADAYAEVLAAGDPADEAALLERERGRFGIDRIQLGVAMLADWGVPRVFCDAVLHRGDPASPALQPHPRSQQLALLLDLARRMGALCAGGEEDGDTGLQRIYRLGARVGCDAAEVARLFADTGAAWREWGEMLKVPTRPVPTLEQIARMQEERLRTPPAPEMAPEAPIRVLAVDDNPVDLLLLKSALDSFGCIVRTAADGREALEAALHDPPDVLVTDWVMPNLDGIGLCRALRDTAHGRRIYIIMQTAQSEEERLYDALAAGADEFLYKPLRRREMEARLHAARRYLGMQAEILRDLEEIRQLNAELAIANRRLQEAALTDFLTRLPNRRHALERLAQDWAATQRADAPLSVLAIDIDNFKDVNDRHGHDVGDAALQRVATLLRNLARAGETVARFGGEEFIVICPHTDAAAAQQFAERLREAVQAAPLDIARQRLPLTVSIGVAGRTERMQDQGVLLKHADDALYEAKRSGRNRVVSARDS